MPDSEPLSARGFCLFEGTNSVNFLEACGGKSLCQADRFDVQISGDVCAVSSLRLVKMQESSLVKCHDFSSLK